MNDMLSIIVPIYNAEKYIKKCINSILNQNYYNIELLLIDDGSCDRSYEICCCYKKKDKRVKCYKQKNSGVSAARNLGIHYATGKYITFVDADDWIESNMYGVMLERIKGDNTDLCICNYNNYIKDKKLEINNIGNRYKILSEKDIINDLLSLTIGYDCTFKKNIKAKVWSCIFKSSIIRDNNLFFNNNVKYSEDMLFCINYYVQCDSISLEEKHLYNYNFNNKSITHNYIENLLDNVIIIHESIENIICNYPNNNYLKEVYQRRLFLNYFLLISNTAKLKIGKINKIVNEIRSIKKHYKNYNFMHKIDIIKNANNFKTKIKLILIANNKAEVLFLYAFLKK